MTDTSPPTRSGSGESRRQFDRMKPTMGRTGWVPEECVSTFPWV